MFECPLRGPTYASQIVRAGDPMWDGPDRSRTPLRHELKASLTAAERPNASMAGEAMDWRQDLDSKADDREREALEFVLLDRAEEIETRAARDAAREFVGIARDEVTPVNVSLSAARRAVRGQTWAKLPGAREEQPNGEHKRKLTDEDVRAIRASSEPNKVLAARHGVTAPNIHAVRKGLTWRHVR